MLIGPAASSWVRELFMRFSRDANSHQLTIDYCLLSTFLLLRAPARRPLRLRRTPAWGAGGTQRAWGGGGHVPQAGGRTAAAHSTPAEGVRRGRGGGLRRGNKQIQGVHRAYTGGPQGVNRGSVGRKQGVHRV
eukprot:1178025-Prorocentrum_minimum.AAC.1